MTIKSTHERPSMITVGPVIAITKGDKTGYTDDGGHAGHKEAGGAISIAPYAELPKLPQLRR